MGNQPSSDVPSSSRYSSSTIPESFFTRNTSETTTPVSYTQHQTDAHRDAADVSRVVFRSSDGEYFSLQKRDTDAHTGALIPATWSPHSMIDLPETSTILRALFAFIGARNHPTLLNESFESLAEIAKAAEKYQVFSAINVCAERMRSFGGKHPKLVLLYAAHNDHPHIFDECAPRVVTSENIEHITPLLPENLRLPWLKYYARWSRALAEINAYSYSSIPSNAWSNKNCWRYCGRLIFQKLGTGVHSLNDPSRIFVDCVKGHTDSCSECKKLCSAWKTHTETQINQIGLFSDTCIDSPDAVGTAGP